jgi:hypothetical protein
MLQPKGQHRFTELGDPAARRAPSGLSRTQQLHHLLRDRRSPFLDASAADVAHGGAQDGDRIDAGVRAEPPVLGRQRRLDHEDGQRAGRYLRSARVPGGPCFVQRLAVAIDDDRGGRPGRIEQAFGQRTDAGPEPCRERDEGTGGDDVPAAPPGPPAGAPGVRPAREPAPHRITTVAASVRPCTSGAYISSAQVPGAVNVPLVVARTR